MKFLLDQDVYAVTAGFLKKLGHNVVRVMEIGHSRTEDEELLRISQANDRILITRDRDYGSLVFVKNLVGGVIYLRILPSTVNATHKELEKVLLSYSEDELKSAFVVVKPGMHRIRRLSSKDL